MINKKIHLEIALQSIPNHPNPKVNLEQYSTTAEIAADVLWNAWARGDIQGKKIVDLGCGTGIFAIGSALLGAKEVVGVDIDPEAIEIARKEAFQRGLEQIITFITEDIRNFQQKADTVIQNPPFGAQKAHRKEADRIFMSKSLEIAPVVYSFHLQETESFVENYFKENGGAIDIRFYYKFPLAHLYHFHQKEKKEVNVVVMRVERT